MPGHQNTLLTGNFGVSFCGSLLQPQGLSWWQVSSCLLLEGLQTSALITLTPLLSQPVWLLYTYLHIMLSPSAWQISAH